MRDIKFRGKRTDNGDLVEGYYVKTRDDVSLIYDNPARYGYGATEGFAHVVLFDTLEQNINGEWMKFEAVDRLKSQRDGLLEAMKYTTKEIQKACEDCGMGGQYCEGCLESLILSEGIKAIAEAEAK